MYKTLPKNVISFFPHFPHFEIFALCNSQSFLEIQLDYSQEEKEHPKFLETERSQNTLYLVQIQSTGKSYQRQNARTPMCSFSGLHTITLRIVRILWSGLVGDLK